MHQASPEGDAEAFARLSCAEAQLRYPYTGRFIFLRASPFVILIRAGKLSASSGEPLDVWCILPEGKMHIVSVPDSPLRG
jgi:hypothetical protein